MFDAARRDLTGNRLSGLIVWALADNERACGFYEHLGGIQGPRDGRAFRLGNAQAVRLRLGLRLPF